MLASFMRKVPGVTLAFLLATGAAMAQVSQMEGTVKGEDGQPLKDAVVRIERKDVKGTYPVKTNKKGKYLHAGLPLGMYRVVLTVDGKDVDSVDNVKTRLGEPTTIDFDLQEIKRKQQAMQTQAQSGQALTQEQARGMTAEQKAAYDKQMKEQQAAMAKNRALNEAFNAGMEALNAKNYDVAIEQFKKAGELDPNQGAVWSNLADAYVQKAKAAPAGPDKEAALTASFDAFQKAIAIAQPAQQAGLHNNYALALAAAHKFDEMQGELQKAIALNPTDAGKYYFNLGAVLTNAGQTGAACDAFKKATEADANYADAFYQYGICLTSKATNKPDGTIVYPEGTAEAFQKYLALKPDGPNAESAKALLATMGAKVDTNYTAPGAAKKSGGKKR